jgi:hypothetical protein
MKYLISKTDYVQHWKLQRFSGDNILPHFMSIFTTGCVDSVDITTRKPSNSKLRSSIYTGKSKTCCIKWQVICDNLGHIIQVDGPFSSLDYDGTIWEQTYPNLDLWVGVSNDNPDNANRYEVIIGDNYCMTGTQCAVPIKRNNRSKLDPIEEQ